MVRRKLFSRSGNIFISPYLWRFYRGNGVYYFRELFANHRAFSDRRRRLSGGDETTGTEAGLVSGSALVVDYMLTITISIASGADALFSFLPVLFSPIKFLPSFFIFGLIFLNLRGVRESVMFLLPIFLLFVVMHIVAITLGVAPHLGDMPDWFRTPIAKPRATCRGWDCLRR